MDKQKNYSLYVLKLEGGKYYIGITSKHPEDRFLEHKNGFYGAEWTKIHKPIDIEESEDLGFTTYEKAEVYENKVTREYIEQFGINNVRGGNLSYRGKMIKKFGYFWRYEDWKDLTMIVLMLTFVLLAIAYVLIDTFLNHWKF